MAYIGKGISTREVYNYTATSNQTAFTGSDINSKTLSFDNTPSLISVFLNGVQLKLTTDYNLDTSNTVTLTSGASASDELMVEVYSKMSFTDAMPKTGGTFSGALSGVDVNGTELILDADGDTSITADTDDRIDFRTGGADRFQIQSTSGNNVVVADGLTLTDGNLVVANGHGIDFSAETGDGPSVTSEVLDSYEEGHIGTIGISVSGSDVVDSTNSNKYYVKVGRVVHTYFHIVLNGTLPDGTHSMTGLPFTSSNSNPAHRGAGIANVQDASTGFAEDGNFITVRMAENSSSIVIYKPVQYVSEDRINLYVSYVTAS